MIDHDVIIIGGGAAGMFAAAVMAESSPSLRILVLEKGPKPLAKVRRSGGGRCNLTHQCPDIRAFTQNYPRGSRELIGPFHRFGPNESAEWGGCPQTALRSISRQATAFSLAISGKNRHRDEFVTCGGIHLKEVI